MTTKYPDDIADDFKKLYESKEDYDAIIIAGKEPNVKEFQVHSLILRTRSTYFRSAFSSNWAEKNDNGHLILKKPNISALVFEIILKYLYCGIVDFQRRKNEEILELLVAADELGVQRLINSVQEFLIQNCYKFLESDLIKMLEFVTCHNNFNNLKKAFLRTLIRNCKEFLRRDPIKLLHFIIHNEEFNKHRKAFLEQEFMLGVWPLRHLLFDNLIEDILRWYLVSGTIPLYRAFPVRWGNFKIDSDLINKNVALLFTKWIDKNIIIDLKTSKKIRYKFNLLFRSSVDGFSSQIFHYKCDNKGATIVVAKISNSNMLVGGYNPLDWNGNGYKTTTDSFIFSLSDLNNLQSAKLGRVNINSNCAVYCNNRYGPTFGGGHDLHAPNNNSNWQCYEDSYPSVGITNLSPISDYEVFQVVKIR
ncbi:13615_t:CDS:2 [Dentiscutata heterogama]|uniref:13615_t:CDS:1 n=1 Tax=Dentiscutata heterogama TaxID=1316150 RepID=A0ACA9MLM0_9GLOM|nr:13615_t:CDS:2 [Dentiscutata heterogama]